MKSNSACWYFDLIPPFSYLHLKQFHKLIASGATREHVETAFDLIWKECRDVAAPEVLAELGRRLGVKDVEAALADEAVKAGLKANTGQAIARGVFGVPTFALDEVLFWGQDSLEMMLDYLKDPALFDTPEMRRAHDLPVGMLRKELSRR